MPVTIGNLRATWSNTTTKYSGIGINVNANAYEANSAVLRLSVNDVDKHAVFPNGTIYLTGGILAQNITGNNNDVLISTGNNGVRWSNSVSTNIINSNNITANTVTASNVITTGGIKANGNYGTQNQILKTTGSIAYWGFLETNTQIFTASSTWTKPSYGSMARIQLWGAGGSGAAGTVASGGGGGGGYREYIVPLVELASSVAVTIGAGGSAVSGTTNGNSGDDTSFGSYTAPGGTGGSYASYSGFAYGGTGGDSLYLNNPGAGGNGGYVDLQTEVPAIANGKYATYGGGGGGQGYATTGPGYSLYGGNGGNGSSSGNGTAGSAPGGGGGGSLSGTSGAGASGKVIVTIW